MTAPPNDRGQSADPQDGLPVDLAAVLESIEWLTGDESHDLDAQALLAGLGLRLRRMGIPLDRLVLHLRTIHPETRGRTLAWAPDEDVEIHDRAHGFESLAPFASVLLQQISETPGPVVVRLDASDRPDWLEIDVFKDRDLVEFVFLPLRNAEGVVASTVFCTRRKGGFMPAERAALERIVPALRNACELRVVRTTALALLDTYVGTGTAKRIFAGHIQRGQVESLNAALMLSDLRGFTHMSNRLPSQRVIELLDDYFDCVVPAIEAAGGEVLKYIGDAVLAFFHRDDAAAACMAALDGALGALARLDRFSAPDAELHAGIALHYGEVSYGNIGSGHRLDFTLIGPDVNLLSRIQTVCSTTGQRLLMSERFAGLLGASRATTIGHHDLKGFPHPVPLYGPII
ncbi:MAG TPA: adenylate/guanylate cyclase domain-containing protein [Xanthomonadaceae bacterium]|jgi:adenylate cyclase|nr:adenylate/guanylate cyclase domain-containing protein [Xanthomonadaceae bacterium]